MSIQALFTVFFILALSVNGFAQVTGGPTAGTTPGTTGTTPGTTQNIPGTTGTIPGTTPNIPGTAPNIPGTTQMPPATTQLPSPTTQPPLQSTQPPLQPAQPLPPVTQFPPSTQFPSTTQTPPASSVPDFRQDNTNITGRFDGTTDLDRGSIFDTRDNTLTGNRDSIFIDDSILGETQSALDGEDEFAIGPETPSTLDNGIFDEDRDSLMDDTVVP